MARALTEGTDKHSAEEFAAELERCGATLDAHADHPGVRVSLEVPALAPAEGALAARRGAARPPRSPTPRSSAWCATGSTRSRTSRPTRPGAPPSSSPRSCSRPPRASPGPARAPRRPSRAIDAAAVRAFYEAHVRPATATAVVVGDLSGTDLDAILADTLGGWTGDTAEPRPVAGDHRRRHRPRRHRGPPRRGPDPAAHRPRSAPTGTTASGRPRCSARTAWAAP